MMFQVNQAEDSHEKSSLIFFEILKIKMSSAAIFVWLFKG